MLDRKASAFTLSGKRQRGHVIVGVCVADALSGIDKKRTRHYFSIWTKNPQVDEATLGSLVHTHKVMPILPSVLVLIGFSNLVCRDQPRGHPSGPLAPSGGTPRGLRHPRWENPIQTRLPQVLLH